jgi:hypothetical protein
MTLRFSLIRQQFSSHGAIFWNTSAIFCFQSTIFSYDISKICSHYAPIKIRTEATAEIASKHGASYIKVDATATWS